MDLGEEDDLVEIEPNEDEPAEDLQAAAESKPRCSKKIRLDLEPELSEQQLAINRRIDSLCEYAHVLMHCVLYKINYYNKKTHFDKLLKYNIIVYVCFANLS